MLLRFRFGNHASINEEQELSLVASSLKDERTGLLEQSGIKADVVPSAIIYGANASGKSSILDAFRYFRFMIRESHNRDNPGSDIPREVHLLDPSAARRASRFEIDFIVDATRYNYGFAVSNTGVDEEWLTAYPNERPQKLFTRKKQRFSFSRMLKGRNQLISELTRPDSLFVSAGTQNDHEMLSIVTRYTRSWTTNSPNAGRGGDWGRDLDKRVIDFLKSVGTGVVSYKRKNLKQPPEADAFIKDFQRILAVHFKEAAPLPEVEKAKSVIELGHRAKDGREVYFSQSMESDGTRRLLHLLTAAYDAIENGTLLIVDELDASLHTHACEEIVRIFGNRRLNTKGAQLIATTHDTNLLACDVLRRDQIWFVTKSKEGASELYPLTDIRTRKDDNFEKGYLEGRYGAVPFRP